MKIFIETQSKKGEKKKDFETSLNSLLSQTNLYENFVFLLFLALRDTGSESLEMNNFSI